MRVAEALKDVRRLFLDTAPIIYLIEKNPNYFPQAEEVFALVDTAQITVLTSGCDAFLTNDLKLKQLSELTVIVLGELTP